MAAAIGALAMPTSFTKGAPSASPLKIWSSKVKPPATAMPARTRRRRQSASRTGKGASAAHRRHSPFVHHPPRTHAGSAAGAVDGQQVDPVLRRVDCPGQIGRTVCSRLQEDVLRTRAPKLLDPLAAKPSSVTIPTRECRSNSLNAPRSNALMTDRIVRIRQHDVPALVEHLRLLEVVDLHLSADVLGALPPLQLDALDAELLDRVFLHAQARVLDVGLNDDRAVAVALVVLVELTRRFRSTVSTTRPFLMTALRVHARHVLADRQAGPGQGRADRQALPVVLGDVGGADPGMIHG
jgi:hypothetical protein